MYVKNSRRGEIEYPNKYRITIFTIDIIKNRIENFAIALAYVGFFMESFERSFATKNWWWTNAPNRSKKAESPAILDVTMLDVKSKIVGIVTETFLFVARMMVKYTRVTLSMCSECLINIG